MLNSYQTGYLREVNPWWQGARDPAAEDWIDRDETDWVLSSLAGGARLLYLAGARRVGKSTILRQAAPQIAAHRATLYASVEDLLAYGPTAALIDELLEFLANEIVLAPLGARQVVLLLDEIHHLDQWQQKIKRFYDARENLAFVVTSSQSPRAQRGKESLAGRVMERELAPFSFGESLRLVGEACPPSLTEAAQAIRRFFTERDLPALQASLTDSFRDLSPRWNELSAQFVMYLRQGGFPEWIRRSGAAVGHEYFRSAIVSKVVNEDIPASFGVTDRVLLQRLLHIALSRSGNEINMSSIASQQGFGRVTVNRYFHYLAQTFLIHLLPRHSGSVAGRQRSFAKVFAVDSGLFWVFERLARHSEAELIGPAAEIAVHAALRRLGVPDESLSYYRSSQNREIDFVVDLGVGRHVPIEVKTASRVPPRTSRLLAQMVEELNAPFALALSADEFRLAPPLLYVPLLMVCA